MNSSFYTDPIVDPLVHVKYESALSLERGRGMAHETRSTHTTNLGIKKLHNFDQILIFNHSLFHHFVQEADRICYLRRLMSSFNDFMYKMAE